MKIWRSNPSKFSKELQKRQDSCSVSAWLIFYEDDGKYAGKIQSYSKKDRMTQHVFVWFPGDSNFYYAKGEYMSDMIDGMFIEIDGKNVPVVCGNKSWEIALENLGFKIYRAV